MALVNSLSKDGVTLGSLPTGVQLSLEDLAYNGGATSAIFGTGLTGDLASGNIAGATWEVALDTAKPTDTGHEVRYLADAVRMLGLTVTVDNNSYVTSVTGTLPDQKTVLSFLLAVTDQYSHDNPYISQNYGQSYLDAMQTYTLSQGYFVAYGSATSPDTQDIEMTSPVFKLYEAQVYGGVISGFTAGKTLDLGNIVVTNPTLGANNVLTVQRSSGPITLQLDPSQDYTGYQFTSADDGNGGTDITLTPVSTGPVSGTDTGVFNNPAPASAVVTGVGTSSFTWGSGQPSSLSFSAASFSTPQGTPFKIGTVTYFNGTTNLGTEANGVELDITVNVTGDATPVTLDVPIGIVTTANTSDPVASADTVSFTQAGSSFHVEEGDTATADIYAVISDPPALDDSPVYTLKIVGFENVSGTGGFLTSLNINGTKSGQAVSDEGTISPFAGVTVADSASTLTQTLTVGLSSPANGTLSNLGGGTYNATTGVYTVTGTTAQVTAALDGLVFTPTPHQVAAGQTVTTGFGIADTDSDGATVTNIATSVIVTATAPAANFTITDATTGQTTTNAGQPYSGPVAGLTSQFIFPTTDQVTITAGTPNVFITVGLQGQPNPVIAGINVATANGNNVLDSYANSSFLTDGTGVDENYLDARALTQNMWSTVVNFHSGDNVTVWGVTQADFTPNWIGDTEGAPGSTGLTGVFVPNAAGKPEAAVTLAGFKLADLTNGKLAITYDTINGTPYASIHAT